MYFAIQSRLSKRCYNKHLQDSSQFVNWGSAPSDADKMPSPNLGSSLN
jgi:hypothetical protein